MASNSRDDWETHWSSYSDTLSDNPAQRFRRRVSFSLLAEGEAPTRLLDIGSGMGDMLAEAAATWPNAELVGVELSGTGIQQAQLRAPQAHFLREDLTGRSKEAHTRWAGWASHAICSEVLEHVDKPQALLEGARRLMAPGCRFVVTVPGGPMSAFDKHIGHRKHFKPGELADLLSAAGYRDVEAFGAGFPVFNLYKLTVIGRGKALITDIENGSDNGASSRFANAAMATFDRLFKFAKPRSRFGWQILATCKVP